MKKTLILTAALTLLTASCMKETKTETTVDSSGSQSSTSVESTTYPGVDTAATAQAAQNVSDATQSAVDKTKEVAHDIATSASEASHDAAQKTGTALEKAGEKLKKKGQDMQDKTKTDTQ